MNSTNKVLDKSRAFKDKTRYFDPLNGVNENTKSNIMLPKIK